MIKITVFRGSDKMIRGFSVSGHSDYSPEREDIVCSAISVLSTNAVNSIEELTDAETDHQAVNEEEGFLSFRVRSVSKETQLLFDSYVLGIRCMEESYGEFIRVDFQED